MASSSTLPATPQLPAERFFRVSLFLLLFTAILTLIGTGKIDIFTSIVAMVALLYRVRRWWYGHGPELQARTATMMVLCYLLFFPVDMFFLSRSLAVELGPRGIRINAVAPGPSATDFNGGAMRDDPELRRTLAAQTALGRVGLAEEIGDAIAALASEDMRWVTAERIEVSGGALL